MEKSVLGKSGNLANTLMALFSLGMRVISWGLLGYFAQMWTTGADHGPSHRVGLGHDLKCVVIAAATQPLCNQRIPQVSPNKKPSNSHT